MMEPPEETARKTWAARDMSAAYSELEHPADVFLEIRGRDPAELFENALYGLYSQMVDLSAIEAAKPAGAESHEAPMAATPPTTIEVCEASPAETLRALLDEALFRFDTEGFVAEMARVEVGGTLTPQADDKSDCNGVRATAHLWGSNPVLTPASRLAEVKAVTYHRLTVTQEPGGAWRATVLFDV